MITNPAEIYFKDGQWGWDGTQWRRLNLLWGFYDRLVARAYTESATAGTNTLAISAVPTGQVYVATSLAAVDLNNAPTYIALVLIAGGVEYQLLRTAAPAAGVVVSLQGQIVAKAGDVLRANLGGCTLNDDIYFWVAGYIMQVNLG